jgi:hypothetical protein
MKSKKPYTKNGTKWTPMTGTVVEVEPGWGPRIQAQSDDGGRYIFSNFEKPIELKIGTRISFDGGHPGEHRGVAINVQEIKS